MHINTLVSEFPGPLPLLFFFNEKSRIWKEKRILFPSPSSQFSVERKIPEKIINISYSDCSSLPPERLVFLNVYCGRPVGLAPGLWAGTQGEILFDLQSHSLKAIPELPWWCSPLSISFPVSSNKSQSWIYLVESPSSLLPLSSLLKPSPRFWFSPLWAFHLCMFSGFSLQFNKALSHISDWTEGEREN